MMKVIKYIGVVCMLSVLAGCVDDKTIDEFKVLNQVTIEGLQERYSVLLSFTMYAGHPDFSK